MVSEQDIGADLIATILGEQGMAAILRRLVGELSAGDVVLTPRAVPRGVLVGRVVGPYRHMARPRIVGLAHQREVVWLGLLEWSGLPLETRRALSSPMALYRPAAQAPIARLLVDRGFAIT